MKSSIIEVKQNPCQMANNDWAAILDEPAPLPVYYRNRETGDEYALLDGAVAWPVLNGPQGCVVIAGASRNPYPTYEVLECIRVDTPFEIMQACVDLRQKYGFKETRTLFNVWVGEDLFDQALYRFNIDLKRKLNFNAPPDFQEPNADEIYIHHLKNLVLGNRLKITNPFVYDEMTTMAAVDFDKQGLKEFPTITAVAYVLYSMDVYRPWVQASTVFNYDDSELLNW